MAKINLLVVSDYGATVIVRPEAEIVLQLQQTGNYNITVMTQADSEYANKFREAGIEVVDFYPTKKFSWEYVHTIRKEMLEGKHHVAQLFNNKAMVNGIMAAMGVPIKVVLYRGYTGNISWLDPIMYVKYLSPRVDRIVCLVEAVRQIFRKNLLFNKDKAVTINKGHDVSWYDGVVAHTKASFGIPENSFVFVCGANIRRMKGVKYLLRATYLLPKDTNIHLMFAGSDMGTPEFKKLIEESPMRDRIHLLGHRKDILEVVKSADAFVLASIKGEAITKAVIEAMSLEVCPLITDIPGNVGLVENGVSGLVVPSKTPEALAEKMLFLSKNPHIAKQYGKAARVHIMKNFNTKDTAKKYDHLYQELYAELMAGK
ncbi:MAG TPA: glycosyltransferase family 4 protein [Chryseosolibacter sp.]